LLSFTDLVVYLFIYFTQHSSRGLEWHKRNMRNFFYLRLQHESANTVYTL